MHDDGQSTQWLLESPQIHSDIRLAQLLLEEPLPSNIEKEARAAAERVLLVLHELLSKSTDPNGVQTGGLLRFLFLLSVLINPRSVPKKVERLFVRKIVFKDVSQGAKRARAALLGHFRIATDVYYLNKLGKPGVSLAAKMYSMDSSQISRICAAPDIKEMIAIPLGAEVEEKMLKLVTLRYNVR